MELLITTGIKSKEDKIRKEQLTIFALGMLIPNVIYLLLIKFFLLPQDISLFLISLISLFFLFIFIKLKLKFPFEKYINYKINFNSFFLFFLISATIIFIRQLFPNVLEKYNQIPSLHDFKKIEYSFFYLISYIFLIPLSEEIIFRLFGFEPTLITKKISFYISCNILVFLILHYEKYKYFSSFSNFCGMLALGVLNYFLCVVFLNTNNLLYSILFHSFYNSLGIIWNTNVESLNYFFSNSSPEFDTLILLFLFSIFFISIYLLNKNIFLKPNLSYLKLS